MLKTTCKPNLSILSKIKCLDQLLNLISIIVDLYIILLIESQI